MDPQLWPLRSRATGLELQSSICPGTQSGTDALQCHNLPGQAMPLLIRKERAVFPEVKLHTEEFELYHGATSTTSFCLGGLPFKQGVVTGLQKLRQGTVRLLPADPAGATCAVYRCAATCNS